MARVLVVDDDEDVLTLVEVQLRQLGHRVVGARSAREALEVVEQRGAPDVAVLDAMLPEASGLDLLRQLREREGLAEVPVIFLSAEVLPSEVAAGRRLGAEYLTKPFVASALNAAIERSLPASSDEPW